MDDRVGKKFPNMPVSSHNPNPGRVENVGKIPSTSRKGATMGSTAPSADSGKKKGY